MEPFILEDGSQLFIFESSHDVMYVRVWDDHQESVIVQSEVVDG